MSWYRWLLCALCLAVADGCWLYVLLGFLGFLAGLGHAPVSFASAQGMLLVAVVVGAVSDIAPRTWRGVRAAVALTAVSGVWLAVAAVAGVVGVRAGLDWPVALLTGGFARGDAIALLTASLVLAWLWRHGMRRARGEAGAPLIARGFRAGLVLLVVALALEAAGGLDLGTRAAVAPFFAASLVGMALARAPAHGSASRAWLVMVGGSVAVVVVAGLVLGTVLVVVVRGGVGVVWGQWLEIATAASESVSATLAALVGPGGPSALDIQQHPMAIPEWLVLLVLLAGAVLMGWLASRLLDAPPKRVVRVVLDLGEEERETVDSGDSRAVERLVDAVLPAWWRRRRARAPRPSRQPPGIAEVYHLYQRLLTLARERGAIINPAHTPFERARELGREVPGAPVDALTARFVAAIYGGEASPREAIAALARQLDEAAGRS